MEIKTGLYRHFKGEFYRVRHIATHSETNERMVVYESVRGGKVWVRPLTMFNEKVDHGGKEVQRFEFFGT